MASNAKQLHLNELNRCDCFAVKERLAKFPKAAQFFKERYPQVVPDEAWALLGGKPATP